MQVWQRGTSFNFAAAGNPYGPDRWCMFSGNTGTVTRQVTGDTTNLPNIQYSSRIQRTAGVTSTLAYYFGQSIESVNSIPFAGKTISYSFYARAGANYSGTLTGNLVSSTGTDQNYITGAVTGQATVVATGTIPLTTTWQRFTYTGTIAATATQIGQFFYWAPTGTAGANDYYEMTGIQIDIGSVALPYRTNGGTIQGELAACERYFYQFATGATKAIGIGTYNTTTEAYTALTFPVTMRTTPTLSATTGTAYYRFQRSGASDDFNSLTMEAAHTNGTWLYNNTEMSGTAGVAGVMKTQDAASSLAFSAEL
jgi:hypothetical protein